jgi:hypothetical protein
MEPTDILTRLGREGVPTQGSAMSAIGFTNPNPSRFGPSAHADYCRNHFHFERTQSNTMRQLEWEGRVQPILPWSKLILRSAGLALLAVILLSILI